MATIHINRAHEMDHATVKKSIQELAEKLSEELSADYSWEKDRLVFKRSGATGFINIGKHEVEVEIKLNLLLSPMKGTIEKTVTSYLDERLS